MMLSVLLLLLLSSVSQSVPVFPTPVEDVPVDRPVVSSAYSTHDKDILKWRTIDPRSLPHGAVSVYNEYRGRTDYICSRGPHSGFYNPKEGFECHAPIGNENFACSLFEILVNKNNFEILEWKDASNGSVPKNAVRTFGGSELYVGKNKFGVGKVDPRRRALILFLNGRESQYSDYQVLTLNRDVRSHQVTDVHYSTDDAVIIMQPPETMRVSVVKNAGCSPVVQTVTLTKEIQQERRWDISSSISLGVTTTMSAGIPGLVSGGLQISTEESFTSLGGLTMSEGITHSVSVQLTAPPNHICKANMLGYKYKANIPFTARLQRTYMSGDTRTTTISGTYKGVQLGEAWAEVEQCQPIPDAEPCP